MISNKIINQENTKIVIFAGQWICILIKGVKIKINW